MQVQPYLFLEGRAEEAIEFYKKALGAEVIALMRMKDSPESPPPGMIPPGSENKVMHASVKIGGTEVMLSDGSVSGKPSFAGVSLSLGGLSAKEAEKYFAALAEGGKVTMPLGKTFFAERFGMVADKFGVSWMLVADPIQP
jgi:PhnB protein